MTRHGWRYTLVAVYLNTNALFIDLKEHDFTPVYSYTLYVFVLYLMFIYFSD